MDLQSILIGLLGLVVSGLGWWVKEQVGKVAGLEEKLNHLHLKVVGEYVHRKDFETLAQEIFRRFDKLQDALAEKVDKRDHHGD